MRAWPADGHDLQSSTGLARCLAAAPQAHRLRSHAPLRCSRSSAGSRGGVLRGNAVDTSGAVSEAQASRPRHEDDAHSRWWTDWQHPSRPRVHFWQRGDRGPPILLLHGFGVGERSRSRLLFISAVSARLNF